MTDSRTLPQPPAGGTPTVLVIGGGASGNAVTVLLRRAGITVDLIEARPDWNATTGSGITFRATPCGSCANWGCGRRRPPPVVPSVRWA